MIMKRIEFYLKRKKLHEEILSAIIALMKSNKCKRIVFDGKNGRMPKVLRWLGTTDIVENVEVKVLKFDGRGLSYKSTDINEGNGVEREWWSLKRNIAQTHVIDLYHAVFNYFEKFKQVA